MPTRSFEEFRSQRERDNERVLDTDHLVIKRFFALDTASYRDTNQPGRLDARTKELLGLVASATLRCNDCIDYHLERCLEQGWTEREIEDALSIALLVGGSIVIPHLRHARRSLDELLGERSDTDSAG